MENTNQIILNLDVGTIQTAYAIMDNDYKISEFAKVDNEEILDLIDNLSINNEDNILVYEEFASYGMAIGKTTMESIKWNGRFIQRALDKKFKKVVPIFRKDVKINLCNTMKAKDTNIRQALINRFATFDFKNGKGTKNNRDIFYGVNADCWSSIAIGVTYLDLEKQKEKENE